MSLPTPETSNVKGESSVQFFTLFFESNLEDSTMRTSTRGRPAAPFTGVHALEMNHIRTLNFGTATIGTAGL
jgi:hypothetical protein